MYSKEHIKPKLHELDQDKLARLYADLRRESLATGSFPITVRHLESMIRMSEASAKMHLREYVRSDDIDLAIQVTVGSFVNAQKMSIKKTLERVSHLSLSSICCRPIPCHLAFTLAVPRLVDRRARSSYLLYGPSHVLLNHHQHHLPMFEFQIRSGSVYPDT